MASIDHLPLQEAEVSEILDLIRPPIGDLFSQNKMGLASVIVYIKNECTVSSGSNGTWKESRLLQPRFCDLKFWGYFCTRVMVDFLRECKYQTPNAKCICHIHARQARDEILRRIGNSK